MAVIELGLVTDGDPAPRDSGPLLARPFVAAALVVCCLLALSGSEVPGQHGMRTLWSLPADAGTTSYVTSGGSLYVLRTDESTLTAHDLHTGAVRWRTATAGDWIWQPGPGADVLLLPTTPLGTDNPYTGADLIAVDAHTGQQLWRRHGDLLDTAGGLALLLEWAAGDGTLRAVRLRDGSAAWSHAAPGWSEVLADAGSGRVVTATGEGTIDVYAYTDGHRLAGATIPWTTRPPDVLDSPGSSLRLMAGTLLLQRDDPGRESLVTAYDTATLTRLWQLTLPVYSGIVDCGPLLCVYAGDSLSGHDRATGERRWQLSQAANVSVLGTDRLLVEDFAEFRLLDAATGRAVADLGEARPVQDPRTGDVTGWFLAPTREPAGLTAVFRLDDRTGRLVLRGAIPRVPDVTCIVGDGVLACPSGGGRLLVNATG